MTNNITIICKKCGNTGPQQTAPASGYEGSAHSRHIHCSKCDAIIAEFLT